jgi:hypothetical protein
MSTHTPGPWEAQPYDEHAGYDCMTGGIAVTAGAHTVVTVDLNSVGQRPCQPPTAAQLAQAGANARLIAAAPDLLATLEAINEWGGRHLKYDIQWAASFGPLTRAAIAKAQGKED